MTQKINLLVDPIISIQVTESKAYIVPVFLDVLSRTAHVPVHADVV